jgi:hypothetical protein
LSTQVHQPTHTSLISPNFCSYNSVQATCPILAWRLRHTLTDQLQKSQFCGVPGNSILDTISCVWDVLAHAEATGTPLCVLTLDFKQASDRGSHQYLFHILRSYGISQWFVERIQALYDQATASVQINGSLAGCIPIRSGVRQGCPISVVRFVLCLHPLVRALEDILPSIKIGRQMPHGHVIAYVDDVTVFVTHPEAFIAIQEANRTYEWATEVCLNPRKSKAFAVGAWTEHPTLLDINLHERVEILGVYFGPTVTLSIRNSWARVTSVVGAQARRAYARHMCLVKRMQYMQLCLYAKIWYVVQVFPLLQVQVQQLTSLCSWYLWQRGTFRVPMTTLHRPKHEGGWGISHVAIKCKTLFYHRLLTLGARDGNVTSDLLRYWHVQEALKYTHYAPRIPAKLIHLHHLVFDMVYVAPRAPDETRTHFRRRMYTFLLRLAMNGSPPSGMRIVRKFPLTNWDQVWKVLHACPATDEIKSAWYKAMHEFPLTNWDQVWKVLHACPATDEIKSTCYKAMHEFPLTNWDQVWKVLHACPATDEIKSAWYKAMHDLLPTNDRLAAIHLTDRPTLRAQDYWESLSLWSKSNVF